jgi:hypothetical protein
MNLGDGPTAILVEKPGMAEKAVQPGETIGQFKMVDVNTKDITFAWLLNGEVVRRSLRELADSTAPAAVAVQEVPSASVASAAPAAPVAKAAIGPGELTTQGTRLCDPNDSMEAGAVVNGFKKTEGRTPFGKFCIWDPVTVK